MSTTPAARRAVLIVSPSEVRRRDWSTVVKDDRTEVTTCAGPSEHCVLLRGLETCPLVARCDAALYDFDATPPWFLGVLLGAHRAAEIVLVRDRTVRGRHRPSVVLRRRPRGTAFEAVF